MSADLHVLLTLHNELVAQHAEREAELVANEAKAREQLEKAVAARAEWARERDALQAVSQIYRRMPGAPEAPSLPEQIEKVSHTAGLRPWTFSDLNAKRPALKARVGPQRYLILSQMRTLGGTTSVGEIALFTGFTTKRVRDQMKADLLVGVVAEEGDDYSLTPTGLDLLARFEAYKTSRGEALPTAADARIGPEDIEEEEDDPHDVA